MEDGLAGARALELEEAVGAGDEDAPVPEATRGLAARSRRDDRAEERHAVDGDHGGSDLVTDEVDGSLVAGAQDAVERVGVGRRGQLRG